jgi:hypothetical protein
MLSGVFGEFQQYKYITYNSYISHKNWEISTWSRNQLHLTLIATVIGMWPEITDKHNCCCRSNASKYPKLWSKKLLYQNTKIGRLKMNRGHSCSWDEPKVEKLSKMGGNLVCIFCPCTEEGTVEDWALEHIVHCRCGISTQDIADTWCMWPQRGKYINIIKFFCD